MTYKNIYQKKLSEFVKYIEFLKQILNEIWFILQIIKMCILVIITKE